MISAPPAKTLGACQHPAHGNLWYLDLEAKLDY